MKTNSDNVTGGFFDSHCIYFTNCFLWYSVILLSVRTACRSGHLAVCLLVSSLFSSYLCQCQPVTTLWFWSHGSK